MVAVTREMEDGLVSSLGEGLTPVVSEEVEFEFSPVLEVVVAAGIASTLDSAPRVASA
jgi:hypothetical protein